VLGLQALLAVQQSGVHLCFDEGMVTGEGLELIVVPEIRAAVAHMRHAGDVLRDPGTHHGRPHLRLAGIPLRLVVNKLIRPPHRFRQTAGPRQITLLVGWG
jgi:hypothetical protein